MKTTFIYFLKDPRPGYFKGYIGKSNNPVYRFERGHWVGIEKVSKPTKKQNWLKSLKRQGLKPILEIIDEVPANTKEEWGFWEVWYMQLFKSWGFDLTNLDNGEYETKRSKETRDKLSKALKGRTPWNKGIPPKPETIEKQKKTRKASALARGYWELPEANEKRKITLKGRKPSPNTIAGIKKHHSTPILQFDLNKNLLNEFPSISEAFRQTKIKQIGSCCRKLQQTAGGFIWEYKFPNKRNLNLQFKRKPKTYKDILKTCKPVLQYDKVGNFIQKWPAAKYAGIVLDISQSDITAVCKGRQKSAGGFVWKYDTIFGVNGEI